jgi:WD40 repeat protein
VISGLAWYSGACLQFLGVAQGNRVVVYQQVQPNLSSPFESSIEDNVTTPVITKASPTAESTIVPATTGLLSQLHPCWVGNVEPEDAYVSKDVLFDCAFFGNVTQGLPKIVAGGQHGSLHVLSLPGVSSASEPRKLKQLQSIQSSSTVLELKRSPTLAWIVISAHENGVCSLWDMHQGCLMVSFAPVPESTNVGLVSLDFHHTGNRLVTASEDNIVCIWQCDSIIDNYQKHQATQQPEPHQSHQPWYGPKLNRYPCFAHH